MEKDLISVQIVAHNAEKTLGKTLESVFAQRGVSFEIIFVNDASTDATLEIAERYEQDNPNVSFTILANQSNQGITKSRNKALKASNGSYIAVLDSDDTWTSPDKLAKQLVFLEANPKCVVVGTQMDIVLADGTRVKRTQFETDDMAIRSKILTFNQFCHSSILMRNVGQAYDESLYIWEDHDMLLTLGQQGTFANLDMPMVDYLFVPKKYPFRKKLKLIRTEFEIIKRHKKKYPNFWLGYFKRIIKLLLTLLHLK
jgi:glycosyltransferase involved in cell wall biosynthesis